MLRLSRHTIDKAKRIEAAGKFLEKSLQSAPKNRDFKHNRNLKSQRETEAAFMRKLEQTYSKVYTNPTANFEYLRLKLFRPLSYAAATLFTEECVRTEITKNHIYDLGGYIDASNIFTDSLTTTCFLAAIGTGIIGQGFFGMTSRIDKDGYIAAIRQSNDYPDKLNITCIRNNNLFKTKRDIHFVKQTDDAVYETTRIQKSSVSDFINQKYWYPTYFITVDARNIEILELQKQHAVVRCKHVREINVNRAKDVDADETFDLILPLKGVKFDKYTAMRKMFGEEVNRIYMKHRKTKKDLE